jgi:hypothetical protein
VFERPLIRWFAVEWGSLALRFTTRKCTEKVLWLEPEIALETIVLGRVLLVLRD